MKKSTVWIVSLLSIAGFAVLLAYGLRHSAGVPTAPDLKPPPTLAVPALDKTIDLTAPQLDWSVWDALPPLELPLMHQLTILPWPKQLNPPLTVKAFHNASNLYVFLTWKDATEDRAIERNAFSDAAAVMLPLGDEVQPASIMMGFMGTVNIWQWKASLDQAFWQKTEPETGAYSDLYYPFEKDETLRVAQEPTVSAVSDLVAIRVMTVTPKERQGAIVGKGVWADGAWKVVLQRAVDAADPHTDAAFKRGAKRLGAFAVWNGAQGDRGGRKSISDWVELAIE